MKEPQIKKKIYDLSLHGEQRLDCGRVIKERICRVAVFGDLEQAESVGLVFHGFSSSVEILNWWHKFDWSAQIAAGTAIVVMNSLGSCFGSTGPFNWHESEPKTLALGNADSFPVITIRDTVFFYMDALRQMGFKKFDFAMGCSFGGMQALQLLFDYPEVADQFIVVAAAPLNEHIKMLNGIEMKLVQQSMLRAEPSLSAIARMLFRYSCTAKKSLNDLSIALAKDGSDILDYFYKEGLAYANDFHPVSFLRLLHAMNEFKIPSDISTRRASAKIAMVGMAEDHFVHESEVQALQKNFLKVGLQAEYYLFDTKFGHESWILDGARFYDFIVKDKKLL